MVSRVQRQVLGHNHGCVVTRTLAAAEVRIIHGDAAVRLRQPIHPVVCLN